MAPLLEAAGVAILLGVGAALAWHACGPSRAWLDPTTPGRLLVLLYIVLVGVGSVLLVVIDARTDSGPFLAGWGLLAFGVGAQLAARIGGIPEQAPRLDQAGPLRPFVVAALALVGLAALASLLLRTGIPLLTSDALESRAELGGIVFDLFRWLVPPAALVAFGLALVRPGRVERRVAVVVLAAVLGVLLAIASRALALELVIGALLIATWAGRRLAPSRWVALATVAAVLFVAVQLARVASVERFDGPLDVAGYAAERTVGRILLIQPRTLDLVVATIPAQEPYFGGATYVRRLAELAGAEPRRPLGRWIYERLFPSQVPPGFASPGVLGEAWANAGPLLALPGMLLLGLFIQALGRLLARTTAGVADAVFAALVTIAVARTYATSLNGFLLTVVVAAAWRLAVAPAPAWLRAPSAFRRRRGSIGGGVPPDDAADRQGHRG
jgi:hypothetical protein